MAVTGSRDDTTNTAALVQLTTAWKELMAVSHQLKTHFQGLELEVQKAMRLKAQIRTENIGLKRSHLELREDNEEELRPTKQARQEAMATPGIGIGGPGVQTG